MDITGATIGDNLEATLIQFQDNFDTSFRQLKTTLAPLGSYMHNTYVLMQNLVTTWIPLEHHLSENWRQL